MEAKVIKIISDTQIVLSVGTQHGVVEGDLFKIIDKKGEEVIDPDTLEVLGTLDIPKATVKVTHVYPRMCVCTNNETISILANPFADLATTAPLKVKHSQISGGFNLKVIDPIQLGDLAYSI